MAAGQALERQREIYISGFAGHHPKVPVGFAALEDAARRKLNARAFAYLAGGAGGEETMQSNRSAIERYRILPRMFRNVSERSTAITLFGKTIPAPIILSPVGVLELAHRDADLAVARAAASLNIPCVFSNQASVAMEPCAQVMGESPRWFQLYRSKSDDLVASFLSRAEACGCTAMVVTLDTALLGWRPRDLDLGYLPFLEGKGIAQYVSDPVFQRMVDEQQHKPAEQKATLQAIINLLRLARRYPGGGFISKLRSGRPLRAVRSFVENYSNAACTWDDLRFLRSCTSLPILLKGILHTDDARKALDHGVDGLIVSNHGGRQVDSAIPAVEALPAVVEVVNGKVPVIVDSGIRTGADIFRALALGATAVGIGRPYVYGLALHGEQGVREVLMNLISEFELTMALSGRTSPVDITRTCISTAP